MCYVRVCVHSCECMCYVRVCVHSCKCLYQCIYTHIHIYAYCCSLAFNRNPCYLGYGFGPAPIAVVAFICVTSFIYMSDVPFICLMCHIDVCVTIVSLV